MFEFLNRFSAFFSLNRALVRPHLLATFGLFLMICGSVGLDQSTKMRAHNSLKVWSHDSDVKLYQGMRYPVWSFGDAEATPGSHPIHLALSLNYVRNQGAAWGFLANMPDTVRIPFFYGVTVIAVLIILVYLRTTPASHRLARFALALILSGAIGNFLDRLRLGFVIDWIDVNWNFFGWRYNFPAFNAADSAITVGVFCLLIDMLILEGLRRRDTSN